ncbi:MAG: glycosyltransferase [Bacteroidales bacterium]|nr:glycosyltransferase [Bacteroidales bacterium]
MRNIIVSVINDLVTDQRVHRMVLTFAGEGHHITLVGRRLSSSIPYGGPEADVRRFRMLFRRGLLFYLFFNVRLFFFLLSRKSPDLLVAVDLDTLPANFLVSRIRRTDLLYDSHEYFTEVPELVHRPVVKRVWEKIESWIVPKLSVATAVSESISKLYTEKYKVDFVTIRNTSLFREPLPYPEFHDRYISTYKLIYQGALNVARGIELLISSMQYMENTMLFIVGDGDIREELQRMVISKKLSEKIIFPGRIPSSKLHRITSQCSIGLSLEEDVGLNYRLSLPNKLFDYIQARIPVLCSDLPEMSALVRKYEIGEVIDQREPEILASQMTTMLHTKEKYLTWKKNLDMAAKELCWENEQEKLIYLLRKILN